MANPPVATVGGHDERPLWSQRPFRYLSYTRFFSRVAQNALNFGLLLLIVDETGRAFFSSLLVLALVLPATATGILAGTLADNVPKRLLIVFGDLARAGVCFAFVFTETSVASYYMVAAGLSIFGQFASSAEGPSIPALVARGRLARANAISNAVAGVAQIVGFAVVTPITLRLFNSPEALVGIGGILFTVAAVQGVLIGRIPGEKRQSIGGHQPAPWWKVGWNQIVGDARVLHAAIELTLMSMTLIILGGLIPSYIESTLGLPIEIGAMVMFPAAIGVALGLRTAGFLAGRVPHTILSTAGFAGFVVLLALLTFVNEIATFLSGYGPLSWLASFDWGGFDGGAAMAAMIVLPLGFFYAVVMVAGHTVIQDLVPLSLQGRVQATQAAMAALAASLPVVVAGALGDWLGVQPVLALVAACIGVAAYFNIRSARRHPRLTEPLPT